jgi:hypothetical protein
MVTISPKPVRAVGLLVLAVAAPFAFTTLYVAITQGEAVHSHVLHQILLVLIAGSCIPFVCWLPFRSAVRLVLAVFLSLLLYVVAWGYGFWAACALFHSCI